MTHYFSALKYNIFKKCVKYVKFSLQKNVDTHTYIYITTISEK